jgi:hypothetical protein
MPDQVGHDSFGVEPAPAEAGGHDSFGVEPAPAEAGGHDIKGLFLTL